MKNEPKATIRLPQAIALYIGAVLGAGILIVPGLAAQIAGPASLIDWGLLMILVLPLALCMAYLAQKYPHAGGVSYFVAKALGALPGMISGWFFLMSVVIGAPVAALTGAGYVSTAFGFSRQVTLTIACAVLLIALLLNYFGMAIAGKAQVVVVAGILALLMITIIAALPFLRVHHFQPFLPHGMLSIGRASTVLFWCFIGWEAVANLSAEFVHPERDVHRATVISALMLGAIYFLTAVAVIGTGSYQNQAQAALVHVAELAFGRAGAILIGAAALLICLATVVAYTGAASRLAAALSESRHAPGWLGKRSGKYGTPLGGLVFLLICFIGVVGPYAARWISLPTLIQLPNATFLLNYLGGCLAGVVLFRTEKKKCFISLTALITTVVMVVFVGWGILYPVAILLILIAGKVVAGRCGNTADEDPQ